MSTTTLKIGPENNGQRMSLADFDVAEAREGFLYELGRGVVVATEVPNLPHFFQVDEIGQQLGGYKAGTSLSYMRVANSNECKILLEEFGSERHPDLAIYLSRPPAGVEGSKVWAKWIPSIVVEVVSPTSQQRDYDEKPDEYLQFGIAEYWIVDAAREQLTVLQRDNEKWGKLTVNPPTRHTTSLLPGFELDIAAVFEAAKGT